MTSPTGQRGALDGLRVLDGTTDMAGAIAAMLLADLGAEVLRIETDSGRGEAGDLAGAPMWQRNKVILTEAPGSAAVAALLDAADVVITSSPERAAALGLRPSPDGLPGGAMRPGLIHLHMPPYIDGAADPLEADALLASAAGAARRQSSFDGGPVESVYPFLSYEQGAWAAATAIAALIERERSGVGQVVVVDGMHGALVATTPSLVIDPSAPAAATDVGPGGANPMYSTYRCSDGRWLFLGALTVKFQTAALRTLGILDLLDDPRLDHQAGSFCRITAGGCVRASRLRSTGARARSGSRSCPRPIARRGPWTAGTAGSPTSRSSRWASAARSTTRSSARRSCPGCRSNWPPRPRGILSRAGSPPRPHGRSAPSARSAPAAAAAPAAAPFPTAPLPATPFPAARWPAFGCSTSAQSWPARTPAP